MRTEKAYLVDEINTHLEKSDHLIVTDYHGIDVEQTTELRAKLAEHGAEFHVIKNRILNVALKQKELPEIGAELKGQNAIITGGEDVTQVVKALKDFYKKNEKVDLKVGLLSDKVLTKDDLITLAELPSMDQLRGQLVGLFVQPTTQLVTVLSAAQRDLLGVLKAKADKGDA